MDFLHVDVAISVFVDPIESLAHTLGGFFAAEAPVTILISFFKAFEKRPGSIPLRTARSRSIGSRSIGSGSIRTTPIGARSTRRRPVRPRTGAGVAHRHEEFTWRNLTIVVAIEFLERLRGCGDLIGREATIVVRIECFEQRAGRGHGPVAPRSITPRPFRPVAITRSVVTSPAIFATSIARASIIGASTFVAIAEGDLEFVEGELAVLVLVRPTEQPVKELTAILGDLVPHDLPITVGVQGCQAGWAVAGSVIRAEAEGCHCEQGHGRKDRPTNTHCGSPVP